MEAPGRVRGMGGGTSREANLIFFVLPPNLYNGTR
jgi:hypothetical protein